jgi:hypothetical protein
LKKDELIKYVKRQLGYPTVNVELTDEQINDSIMRAIDEIKPWYTIFKYLTIDVNNKSVTDLSEYRINDVTDVIKVFDISNVSGENSIIRDPFSYSGMNAYYGIPMYAVSNYSTSIMTNQSIHRVISNYASMYQEYFYSALATMMQKRTLGTLTENISWKFYDNKLYVDTGTPSTSVVTIEYIPQVIHVEDFEENTRYINYLKDLSVAFCLIIQARVTGKYSVS